MRGAFICRPAPPKKRKKKKALHSTVPRCAEDLSRSLMRLGFILTFQRQFVLIKRAISLHPPHLHRLQRETKRCRAHFLAPAVLPRHPLHSVAGVAQSVAAGELLAVSVGVAALSPHQSQEVEFAQVHLLADGGNAPLINGQADWRLCRSAECKAALQSLCWSLKIDAHGDFALNVFLSPLSI